MGYFLERKRIKALKMPEYEKTLRGGYVLTREDIYHVIKQYFFLKEYPYVATFLPTSLRDEILKLYIEVWRALRFRDKKGYEIFNECRKVVLEKFGFKDKHFATLPDRVLSVIQEKTTVLQPFTEEEEKELYDQDPNLWRARYTCLKKRFTKAREGGFYDAICGLGIMDNAHAKEIYFKAFKFLATRNKIYALMCYLHYVNIDSFGIINIQPVKMPHRSLFQDAVQETEFKQIIENLLETHDINYAVKRWKLITGQEIELDRSSIEETQEKQKQISELLYGLIAWKERTWQEIELDKSAIEEAQEEQKQVSELLGKYLSEEEAVILANPVLLESAPATAIAGHNEICLFQLFEQNDYKLGKKKINIFAAEKGIFRDSFIQHINEMYFDELDDILIEEDAGAYFLNKEYYKQVKK
jgi:hypothetical protein